MMDKPRPLPEHNEPNRRYGVRNKIEKPTIVVWFSCGAASAVAAKKTIEVFPKDSFNVRVVNNPIAEEDDDNLRFLKDVENWIKQPIEFSINPEFPKCSITEVWDKRKYISGIKGAPCTLELKKKARYAFEADNDIDFHVLGFTSDEARRYENFTRTERQNTIHILGDLGISKNDCYDILRVAGIQLPLMYRLGYPNANCPGCGKATSPTYWNHVRLFHPDVFVSRSEQSRRIGAKLVRYKGERIYLDELPKEAMGRPMKSMPPIDCGLFCEQFK